LGVFGAKLGDFVPVVSDSAVSDSVADKESVEAYQNFLQEDNEVSEDSSIDD